MVIACLVISQDHVIKGSCAFIGSNPSRFVTALPSLVAIGTLVVISKGHGLKTHGILYE